MILSGNQTFPSRSELALYLQWRSPISLDPPSSSQTNAFAPPTSSRPLRSSLPLPFSSLNPIPHISIHPICLQVRARIEIAVLNFLKSISSPDPFIPDLPLVFSPSLSLSLPSLLFSLGFLTSFPDLRSAGMARMLGFVAACLRTSPQSTSPILSSRDPSGDLEMPRPSSEVLLNCLFLMRSCDLR